MKRGVADSVGRMDAVHGCFRGRRIDSDAVDLLVRGALDANGTKILGPL